MKRIDAPQIVKSFHRDEAANYRNGLESIWIESIEYHEDLYIRAEVVEFACDIEQSRRYFYATPEEAKAFLNDKYLHSWELSAELEEYGDITHNEWLEFFLYNSKEEIGTVTDFTRQHSTKLAEMVLPMAWNGQQSIYEVTTDKGLIQLVAFIDHDSYLKYEVYRGGRKLLQSEVQSFLSDLRIFNVKDLSPETVAA